MFLKYTHISIIIFSKNHFNINLFIQSYYEVYLVFLSIHVSKATILFSRNLGKVNTDHIFNQTRPTDKGWTNSHENR